MVMVTEARVVAAAVCEGLAVVVMVVVGWHTNGLHINLSEEYEIYKKKRTYGLRASFIVIPIPIHCCRCHCSGAAEHMLAMELLLLLLLC